MISIYQFKQSSHKILILLIHLPITNYEQSKVEEGCGIS